MTQPNPLPRLTDTQLIEYAEGHPADHACLAEIKRRLYELRVIAALRELDLAKLWSALQEGADGQQ